MGQAVRAVTDMEGKYLMFILGNEEYGIKLNTDYILGMANLEGGVKVLLDIDRVMSGDQIGQPPPSIPNT